MRAICIESDVNMRQKQKQITPKMLSLCNTCYNFFIYVGGCSVSGAACSVFFHTCFSFAFLNIYYRSLKSDLTRGYFSLICCRVKTNSALRESTCSCTCMFKHTCTCEPPSAVVFKFAWFHL